MEKCENKFTYLVICVRPLTSISIRWKCRDERRSISSHGIWFCRCFAGGSKEPKHECLSLQQNLNFNTFPKQLIDAFIISILLSLLSRLDVWDFEIHAVYVSLSRHCKQVSFCCLVPQYQTLTNLIPFTNTTSKRFWARETQEHFGSTAVTSSPWSITSSFSCFLKSKSHLYSIHTKTLLYRRRKKE